MKVPQLVNELEQATGPNPRLDQEIARVVELHFPGYSSGIYKYTSSLDAALVLAQLVAPKHVCGFCWEEDGTGTATIGDGPYYRAATPAIALCIAAMTRVEERQEIPVPAQTPIKGPWRVAKMINKTGEPLKYCLRKVGAEAPLKLIDLEVDAVFSHGIREAGVFEIVARAGERTIWREVSFADDEYAKIVVLE